MKSNLDKQIASHLETENAAPPQVLLRIDDVGMCHSVNMAVKKLLETRFPFSVSIMFPCSWYPEAVEILKDISRVSVGIHLTLNAEWQYYKWGPLSGSAAVPSLVDRNGHFYASKKEFLKQSIDPNDFEKELRAQIERGLQSGLHIDYLDFHMGTAVATLESAALIERLADEYQLGISQYFNEHSYQDMFLNLKDNKAEYLYRLMKAFPAGSLNLLVFYIGMMTPEIEALFNPTHSVTKVDDQLPILGPYRQKELDILCSEAFAELVRERRIQLINYRELIEHNGLTDMQRPDAWPWNKLREAKDADEISEQKVIEKAAQIHFRDTPEENTFQQLIYRIFPRTFMLLLYQKGLAFADMYQQTFNTPEDIAELMARMLKVLEMFPALIRERLEDVFRLEKMIMNLEPDYTNANSYRIQYSIDEIGQLDGKEAFYQKTFFLNEQMKRLNTLWSWQGAIHQYLDNYEKESGEYNVLLLPVSDGIQEEEISDLAAIILENFGISNHFEDILEKVKVHFQESLEAEQLQMVEAKVVEELKKLIQSGVLFF